MALIKQQLSIDLLKGTDTKENEQITKKPQDMINVVFTGNMTPKKRNGFNLIGSLPSNEYYSSIFTRGNDLLAQTDKGTYKYLEKMNLVSKIDDIGSTSVDTAPCYGDIFCSGNDFDCHVSLAIPQGGGFATTSYFKLTFTDKSGNVINTLNSPCSTGSSGSPSSAEYFKFVKVVNQLYVDPSGNRIESFIFLNFDINGSVIVDTYLYSPIANTAFVKSLGSSATSFKISHVNAIDLHANPIDTTGNADSYMAIDYNGSTSPTVAAQKVIIGFSLGTPVGSVSIDTGANGSVGNLQLSRRSDTSMYLSFTSGSSIATNDLIQGIYTFTTPSVPVFVSNTILYNLGVSSITNGTPGLTEKQGFFVNYPTSDTSSIFFWVTPITSAIDSHTFNAFYFSCSTFSPLFVGGVGNSGNIGNAGSGNLIRYTHVQNGITPVSEIFSENGNYYVHCVIQDGLGICNVVINISTGAPVATFGFGQSSQKGIKQPNVFVSYLSSPDTWNLNASVGGQLTTCCYTLRKIAKYNSQWGMAARYAKKDALDYVPSANLYFVNFNAVKNTTQIELTQKTHIFNGQPAYYDGSDLSELGFNGAPCIHTAVATAISGSITALPVDSSYQIVAIYKWTDAVGNVFRSGLSNIAGLDSQISISANQYIKASIAYPMISTKSDIICEVYIKKQSDQFRLSTAITINKDTATSNGCGQIFTIQNYPTDGATYLYATSTFTAGGDYPTEPITDSSIAAIHEDRFFTVSKDHPTSISFSQQKLEGYGAEFNQDIFYIDVYDKRGVYEDTISGLSSMDGRLIIFKERSILYVVGSGPSRANTQNDISSPQLITTDVGCISSKSIVLMPTGIMFMSDKGIYLLDRKLQVEYIGAPVERFNSNNITSAILLEKVNEVRFTSLEGEVLVYNYYSQAWSWFTGLPCVSACIWKGQYTMLLTSGKIYVETSAHKKIVENGVSTAVIQKISTPWIRIQEVQYWQRVFDCLILGYYKSEHQVKVSFYYDYELYASDVYTLDPLTSSQYNITNRPTNGELESGAKTDGVYQLTIDMIRKTCQAFRVEIEDIPLNISSNSGESFALSNITVTVGAKNGPAKLPGSKSY